jgi:lysophospholipase L1-like esterase
MGETPAGPRRQRQTKETHVRRPLAFLAVAAAVLGLLLAGTGGASAGPRSAGTAPTYYLSLGDSLATGFQPDVQKDTDLGYPDKVYAQLKQSDPNLQLVKLGCDHETTVTMINGGFCTYTDHTGKSVPQLAKAVDFLKQNGAQVRFVTMNIGGNDVGACATASGIDVSCTLSALTTLTTNYAKITSAIDSAASTQTSLAGANSFNPFLVTWLGGPDGQAEAAESAGFQAAFNEIVTKALRSENFDVADFAGAFQSFAFTPQVDLTGFGTVPTNVATICRLTFACTQLQDIHPNPTGHQALANAFLPAL